VKVQLGLFHLLRVNRKSLQKVLEKEEWLELLVCDKNFDELKNNL
jgi:hypothetical protein